ncbi:c-type cytochrome [Sphingobacterium cellulitidis]|uniref:c-type cytochrome n=1 Tax=Sphingobacterium cellulitidis TaxID=1768011 RepID=UPI003C7DCC47
MENNLNQSKNLLKEVNKIAKQTKIVAALFVFIVALIILQALGVNTKIFHVKADENNTENKADSNSLIHIKDFKVAPFPDTEEGKMAALGEKLIIETPKYLGPNNKHGAVFTGNNLACGSCHLNGGTKEYAAPYIGLSALFPIYSGREGKVATLEERINGCFERSMNGKKLPFESTEMIAIVSYIKHLSKDVKVGGRIEGQGFVELKAPDRRADLQHGESVFKTQCVSCHQPNGLGLPKKADAPDEGYMYPPLWGSDSFNDGAGMGRMLTAAKFIKGNMPLGASAESPILSDEEAYDVAAYINSFERPSKVNKEKDYPDLSKKPKDSPYPPFADNIPEEQHKYGPFNF